MTPSSRIIIESQPPLFSSRSITPDAQDTHREAYTADAAPHKLNPLLLSRVPLYLFAIDIVHVLIHNALLQALLHGKVQATARSGHKTGPEQVWVSDASRTESESGEQRYAGEGGERADV